jgi:hypothetical protein
MATPRPQDFFEAPAPVAARGGLATGGFVATVALIALAAGAYAAYFHPFLSDDALISLRYAQRLLDGHGLSWTDGRPVEGYTNLLWVLLAALLGALGIDLITAARALGILCTVLTGTALLRLQLPGDPGTSRLARAGALLLFGLAATTAVWAIGGLEQPLIGAALAWALLGVLELAGEAPPRPVQAVFPGCCYAAMCLTRPDSPLFVVASCLALWLGWRSRGQPVPWRALLVLAGIPFLAYLGQTLFRHAYYGEWVTNTALVKVSPSRHHAWQGLVYLGFGALTMAPLGLAAAACLRALGRAGDLGRVLVLLVPALMWSAYVIAIGGDIFPAYRHCTPLVVLAAFMVALGAAPLLGSLSRGRAIGVVLLTAGALLLVQGASPEVQRARSERWEWTGRDLAQLLKAGFGDRQPLMAVSAAGCLPYFTRYPVIDMLGLNDYYLPRHPPPPAARLGVSAHDLGSGPYILARRPDLIVYDVGAPHDAFLTGHQLDADPAFRAAYTPVVFDLPTAPGGAATVWVNRESPLIGLRREAEGVWVPGYLVNGNPASRVHLGPGGGFALRVTPATPAEVTLRMGDEIVRSPRVEVKGRGEARVEATSGPDGTLHITVRALDAAGVELEGIEIS